MPDQEGVYVITLVVSDALGPGEPVTVQFTALTVTDFAELQIVQADRVIAALMPWQIST